MAENPDTPTQDPAASAAAATPSDTTPSDTTPSDTTPSDTAPAGEAGDTVRPWAVRHRRPAYKEQPRVLVIGAGVTGLTAAHELALRGFAVDVIQKVVPGRTGKSVLMVGGIAASQFFSAETAGAFPEPPPKTSRPGEERVPAYGPPAQPGRVVMERVPDSLRLPGEHGFRFFPSYYHHLFDTMQRTPLRPEAIEAGHLAPKGFRATGGAAADEQEMEEFGSHRRQRKRHGAHLAWRESRSTVYDNVLSCNTQMMTSKGDKPNIIVPRQPVDSEQQRLDLMREYLSAGFAPQDIDTFLARVLRWSGTCPDRRATFEDVSYLDYVQGVDEPGGRETVHYSRTFIEELQQLPKVLAAFDAQYGDARTNMDTYVQLQMNTMYCQPKGDGVLNGPTTGAFFSPWRAYLERELGVIFYAGQVDRLELDGKGPDARIRPQVTWQELGVALPRDWKEADIAPPVDLRRATDGEGPGLDEVDWDYVVVATSAPVAERISRPLARELDVGVPAQLQGYFSRVCTAAGCAGSRERTGPLDVGETPFDRFQVLTGLQYYFDTQLTIVQGHVYFGDSPWALSSINEQDWWLAKPTLQDQGFVSVLSVDIGDWDARSPVLGKSARECTPDEIAQEVYRQITAALLGSDDDPRTSVPVPKWYSIDRFIEFDDEGNQVAYRAPYLIPLVSDWQNRPGAEPWNPGSFDGAPQDVPDSPDLWQAGHGGSWVHWNSLLYAGVYKKTFTRMTTMEAANESARHAVNAVLDHYCWVMSEGTDPRDQLPRETTVPYGFVDQFNGDPRRFPTPAGDYCMIWNIEDHELSFMQSTRQLDQLCWDLGLPHPWKLLGIDAAVSLASLGSYRLPSGEMVSDLMALNEEVLRYLRDARRAADGDQPRIEPAVLREMAARHLKWAQPTGAHPGAGLGGAAGLGAQLGGNPDLAKLLDPLGLLSGGRKAARKTPVPPGVPFPLLGAPFLVQYDEQGRLVPFLPGTGAGDVTRLDADDVLDTLRRIREHLEAQVGKGPLEWLDEG